MTDSSQALIRYDRFIVDRHALEIRERSGAHVPVGPQGVRLFLFLYDHLDEVVTRGDIYEALWPESEADVNRGLNTLVRQLRIGLCDTAGEPRYIRTYQARGYRLLPVTEAAAALPADLVEESEVVAPMIAAESPTPSLAPARRRRARFAVATFAGMALLYAWAQLVSSSDRDGVTMQVIGVRVNDQANWIAAVEREAERQGGRPHLAFSELGAGVSRVLLIRKDGADTLWSAALRGAGPGERDSLVTEAVAVTRSIAEQPDEVAAATLLSTEHGELVARARHFLHRGDPRDRHRAAALLERALLDGARAPGLRADFAEALFHAGMLDSAYRVARHSMEKEPGVAVGWFMAGVTAHLVHWDWAQAERQVSHAIQLEPDAARFYSALAFIRATAGDRAGARAVLARVLRTGGEDALTAADLGHITNLIGDYAAANEYCEQSLELADLPGTRGCLVTARLALGDTAAAQRLLGAPAGGISGWRSGRADAAIAEARRTNRGWYVAAEALAAAGRTQDAREALREAVTRRDPWVVMAMTSHAFTQFSADTTWRAILGPVVERRQLASGGPLHSLGDGS